MGEQGMGSITPYSALHLIQEAKVDPDRWNRVPPEDIVLRTVKQIKHRGITVYRAGTADEGLATLQSLVPSGSEVMNGSSTTLLEIGYERLLKSGTVDWIDLHARITAEADSERRDELRRKSVTAEYFFSGVNAIAETGELVACDRTGSRIGAWPYAAAHLILVSGINKIVPTLSDAFQRVREYVFPLENARAKRAYGVGSHIGKCVVLEREDREGRVFLVLIDENLGY
jgi:L-lactate utilization protein LutB